MTHDEELRGDGIHVAEDDDWDEPNCATVVTATATPGDDRTA